MRTAIYTRVSTRMQENTTSLPEQERLSREKARTLGYGVSEPHVYHEVESGEDLYRPEMERLWGAIERHEIDSVVIDVLDRLSRDEGDVGAFYHHADRHGVTIEVASEDRDETEKGRMMRTVTGMLARMERAEIMRRTQRGRRARAARGDLFPASVPLYGYLWANEQHSAYVADPETAPIIVRIWTRIAEGASIRAVARELDADGIPTPAQLLRQRGLLPAARPDPTDKGWHPGSLARMLRHPAYVGQHAAYRFAVRASKERSHAGGTVYKVTKMRERAIDDPERVTLPLSTCPALIEPELAARVRAVLALNKANSAGNNPDPLATVFRGMTYCGHCGDKMGTSKSAGANSSDGRPQRRCYRCNSARVPGRAPCPGGMHSVAASVLDPAAWADIVAWLSNPKNVARLMDEWQQQERRAESSIGSRLDAVNAHLISLRDRMSALADDISATQRGESRRVLNEKLDELAQQMTRAESKREQLLRDAQAERDRAREARDICAWAAEVSERAGEFTREMQIDTLRALGARVSVWRGEYQHPDGWPQRYKVTPTFTGFSGHAVTLPAVLSSTSRC